MIILVQKNIIDGPGCMKNVNVCPLEGVGGQTWVTFGQRSCSMPPEVTHVF